MRQAHTNQQDIPDMNGQVLRLITFLKSEPALVVTLSYLTMTAIGTLYSWLFYRHFGVRVIDYAEVNDFLMAALREPVAMIIFLLPMVLVYLIYRLDRWARTRFRSYNWFYRWRWINQITYHWSFILLTFVLYAWLFVDIYSGWVARRILHADQGRQVTVALDSGSADDKRGRKATLLGRTTDFLLLYRKEGGVTEIIPIENVARIELSPDEKDSATSHRDSPQSGN